MDSDSFLRRNLLPRIFHAAMAVVFLVVLALSVGSIGKFAPLHYEISKESVYGRELTDRYLDGSCILFASTRSAAVNRSLRRPEVLVLSSRHVCQAAIGGEAAVGLIALVLCVTSVVKALAGIPM